MKKIEVKKGLIVSLPGIPANVRIESDEVNWNRVGPGVRPTQSDQSRGVLVRYVKDNYRPLTRGPGGLFVTTLQSLKLIPGQVVKAPPTIAELQQIVEELQDKVVALEARTLIEITCPDCNGSGLDSALYVDSVPCKRCAGYSQVPALSTLGEE